jgi:hypothetical protein
MALTVDGDALFGPGPHEVVAGAVQRRAKETLFPGLDGVYLLTLRGDRQPIAQQGLLVGTDLTVTEAEAALQALKDGLNALVYDGTHSLVDDFGRTYSGLVLEEWRPTGPREGPVRLSSGQIEVRQPYAARWLAADFEPES